MRIAGQYMIGMSALAAISTLAPEASSSKPGENSSTSTQKFQKEEGKFKGSITNVINNISLIKNPIFFIEVPIINAELSASQGNYQEASYYLACELFHMSSKLLCVPSNYEQKVPTMLGR